MKKILTIVLVLLLQNGFCNNNELIEKLSKDNDFKNLCKSSVGFSLIKYKQSLSAKLNVPISEVEKKSEEKYQNNSMLNYNIILNKYPEINKLERDEKVNVFREAFSLAATLTYAELAGCFGGAGASFKNCFVTASGNQKTAFYVCLTLSGFVDLIALWETGGQSITVLKPAVEGEFDFCTAVSIGAAANTCLLSIVGSIVSCILLQGAD